MIPDRYREAFGEEARELLLSLTRSLVALDAAPADEASLHEIYRVMHTLKSRSFTLLFRKPM